MIAKITSKHQLTLPKAVAIHFKGVDYFVVSTDGTMINLRPVTLSRGDEIRERLALLGISEKTVAEAYNRVILKKNDRSPDAQ